MKTIKQLLITIAVLLCSATTYAYDFEVDGIYYNIISMEDLTVEVTSVPYYYDDYSGEVVIPSTVNYNGEVYSVISIGEEAFYNCSGLTSIEIPNSVIAIEDGNHVSDYYGAFERCFNLTTVIFGENSQLTSIGDYAFYNCSSLTNIEIPNFVTSIGGGAFYNCDNLTSIKIPNSVTSIGKDAFSSCSSLTSVTFGENSQLTSIGGGAFYNCSGLTSIEIPNSVIAIEDGNHVSDYYGAFEGCSNLKTVTFGENSQLTSIGYNAFRNCSSLTNIEIPNFVTSIGKDAFSSCSSLTSVTFGENSQLTSIGGGAFYNCDSLTSIEIPDSVISFGPPYESYADSGAFEGCSNLKTVTFGENSQLTSIGYNAFRNCSSLTNIEIPNSVTSIGGGAFLGCSSLTSIEIPNSVISIEYYYHGDFYGAFQGCSNLKKITFEENSQLTSIGSCTFYECSSLTSIEIPDSVISIGSPSESYCDSGAFEGCSNLKTVTFGENPQLTFIGYDTFRNCLSLTNIEIPNSVTSIGYCAFCGCLSLTNIEIPDTVTSIGCGAFRGCSSLTSVEIPSSVISIGFPSEIYINYGAFEECSSLTSIEIPNSVTSIGEKAFYGCTSLKDFKIEDGYTTLELGYRLFKNCALETIYLGRNISYDNSENPEDLLFDDMITLKSLTVGSSVTEIPGKTFYDCTNLESVYMRGVPPVISDDTFSNASFYIATLYVPEGTLAFYQAANVWKNFWNIQEYEPTSIEDVEADEVKFTISSNGISFSNANNTTIAIYTINGILVEKIDKYTGEDIFLDKGIYIVSVGNKTMKIKL